MGAPRLVMDDGLGRRLRMLMMLMRRVLGTVVRMMTVVVGLELLPVGPVGSLLESII
jgi:hypothetical protein